MKCYQIEFEDGYRMLVDANTENEAREFVIGEGYDFNVRGTKSPIRDCRRIALRDGANALAHDYTADKELSVFTVLDTEEPPDDR